MFEKEEIVIKSSYKPSRCFLVQCFALFFCCEKEGKAILNVILKVKKYIYVNGYDNCLQDLMKSKYVASRARSASFFFFFFFSLELINEA